jgi:creatinine amidohydrolase
MLDAWIDAPVFQWMTWQEIGAEAAAGSTIAVAIGATEQHGPHLPVCTDWVIPTEILRQATRHRHFLVGPTISFGYRSRPGSGGGQHFPGTVSLRATTLMAVIEDVLSELVRAGFRKIVVYNWHFENVGFVYEPAALVSERHPDVKIVVVEDALPPLTPDEQAELWPDGFPGLALEHAALIETSLWLHLESRAVDLDRMVADGPERHPPYDILPIDLTLTTASGSLASPLGADAAKGEMLTRRTIGHFIDILDREFPSTVSAFPAGLHA